MAWSQDQEKALKDVGEWLKSGTKKKQIYRLDGFAGTGKTTLAKHMADMVKGQVSYATLSGKAASVLRSKGCVGAGTIHSLIYRPDDKKSGNYTKAGLKKVIKEFGEDSDEAIAYSAALEEDAKRKKQGGVLWRLRHPDDCALSESRLLVLDEVSMVGEELGRDLLSFGVPILAIGDPAQLPPIEGGGFFQRGKADSMLVEIHRQAKGNPIIDMSMRIREGDLLKIGDYGEGCGVVSKGETNDIMCGPGVDQVLCGTHRNRNKFNKMIRRRILEATDHMPLKDDKLICLSNDKNNRSLLNGTLWYVGENLPQTADQIRSHQLPLRIYTEDDDHTPDAEIVVLEEMFTGIDAKEMNELRKGYAGFQWFDYGYAITVHKSQGSQWNNVVVFDDGWVDKRDPTFRQKWLYTAITRAAEKVTLIR